MKHGWLLGLAAAAAVSLPAGASPAKKLIDCTCYDLFVVSLSDGGHGRLLSRGGGRNLFDVSADRKKILYSTVISELHASNVRARFKRTLATSPWGEIRDAHWSPDGRWVLYESDSPACPGNRTEARVVDRDGDGDHRIGCTAYLTAWSDTSSRLVYDQYVDSQKANSGIRLIVSNRDGSGQHVVAQAPNLGGVYWSPRGDWIAYATGGYRNPSVRLVRPDGSHDHRLAPGSTPTWSPDGRRIAFEWQPKGVRTSLAVIDANGKHFRVLDRLAVDPYSQGVGWSREGRIVVYRRMAKLKCAVCRMALYVSPVARPNPRRILTGDAHEEFGPLYWLPAGKEIVYTSYVQEGV